MHTEQLNVTDVVTSRKQAQKVLRHINVARRAEDPIDRIIIERIVNDKNLHSHGGDNQEMSSSLVMPRKFDINQFMKGIESMKEDN